MADLSIVTNSANESVNIFIQDSRYGDGRGLGGLVAGSSGLTAYYSFTGIKAGSNVIALVALSAITAPWAGGGFKEIDSVNMLGWYRLDLPSAALVSGKGREVNFHLQGAANMAAKILTIELTGWDNQDAQFAGLSAMRGINVVSFDDEVYRGFFYTDTGESYLGAVPGSVIKETVDSVLGGVSVQDIVNAVWDEQISSGKHNIRYSAGNRMRIASSSGTASNFAQSGTINTITLATTESSTNGTYDPSIIVISEGTGAGQARLIIDYVGATRVATVDRDWRVAPDSTSVYDVIANTNLLSTNEGLAQAGTINTITLNSSASSANDTYLGQVVVLRTGTGQDQSRIITAYNGSSKIATVDTNWVTIPGSASGYMIYQTSRLDALVSSRLAATDYTAPGTVTSFTPEALANLFNMEVGETYFSAIDNSVIKEIVDNTTVQGLVGAILDELLASHTVTGSVGAALTSAATGGDPWIKALPGAYLAGTAGYILGTNLDAKTSLALQTTSYTAPDNASIAAIKLKTDSLTFTTPYQVDSNSVTLPSGFAAEILAGLFNVDTGESFLSSIPGSVVNEIVNNVSDSVNNVANSINAVSNPWSVPLPGSYAIGTAGYIVGNDLPSLVAGSKTLTAAERDAIAAATLDLASGIETGYTLRQSLRLILSALVGKLTGAAEDNIIIRDINDTKDRISAEVDSSGNRLSVAKDAT